MAGRSSPAHRIPTRVAKPLLAICQIHGPTTIVTGDSNVKYDSQFVAREGDKLACGASLIVSQAKTGSL
jgi:uncharacterized Zn-binding protein involved in type VI secretion